MEYWEFLLYFNPLNTTPISQTANFEFGLLKLQSTGTITRTRDHTVITQQLLERAARAEAGVKVSSLWITLASLDDYEDAEDGGKKRDERWIIFSLGKMISWSKKLSKRAGKFTMFSYVYISRLTHKSTTFYKAGSVKQIESFKVILCKHLKPA